MTKEKTQLAVGYSVIALTRCLMEKFSLSCEDAYKKLLQTDFFDILNNPKSGLCLEPDWYLCEACLLEIDKGRDTMIEYINNN